MVKLIQFDDREVLLCMVKLVNVVLQVPLREALSQEQLAGLERLVVDYRQNFFLLGHIIDDFPPNLLVPTLSEEHVVHCVEHTRVVELVSHLFKSLFEGGVQLRIAQVTNTVGIHEVRQVSVRNLVHI